MAVAVYGGTGFIGSAVVRRLLARGLEPLVLARGHHSVAVPDGARFIAADRQDGRRLVEIFQQHGVDTVIDIFALGLGNSAPMLEAMGAVGGRYVLLSSVDVYANYGGLLRRETPPVQAAPAREDDPLRRFRYPYRQNERRPKGVENDMLEDYDKIILEEATAGDGRFATTVIRAPMVFGPGDKQHRFGWAIDAVRRGGVVEIDQRAAGWPNSYGYVEDVGEAIALAATAPQAAGRVYNVGQDFVRTPVEWLLSFAVVLGRPIEVLEVPPDKRGLLADRADASDLRYPLTLDTSRIRQELGFAEIVPEREALLRTIAAEQG
ncbi:MAG TPA: NAD-dependent epimerase/dehydratase family protein [Devosia sp.]|nr:NAD-dependent epimerase/dehydratase family protein [Devosia sp.]